MNVKTTQSNKTQKLLSPRTRDHNGGARRVDRKKERRNDGRSQILTGDVNVGRRYLVSICTGEKEDSRLKDSSLFLSCFRMEERAFLKGLSFEGITEGMRHRAQPSCHKLRIFFGVVVGFGSISRPGTTRVAGR